MSEPEDPTGPKGKGRQAPGLVLGVCRVKTSLKPSPRAKGKRGTSTPKSKASPKVRVKGHADRTTDTRSTVGHR